MSKGKNKKQLDRREFIDQYHKDSSFANNQNELSEFSQRALKGMQYLPEGTDLTNTLHRIDQRIDQKTRPKRRFLPFLLKIAASLLILIIPIYFLFQTTSNPEQLFAQSFQAIPSAIPQSGIDRGEHASQEAQHKALALYEQEKYSEAIPVFESYLENQEANTPVRFYYGISLLAEQKAHQSIEQFERVFQESTNHAYQRSAQWYQALAYLLLNQKQNARAILEELTQKDGDFHEEAQELIEQL